MLKNDRFWQKIRPILVQIISGTKCDINKQIFFLQKDGVNMIELAIIWTLSGIGKF